MAATEFTFRATTRNWDYALILGRREWDWSPQALADTVAIMVRESIDNPINANRPKFGDFTVAVWPTRPNESKDLPVPDGADSFNYLV